MYDVELAQVTVSPARRYRRLEPRDALSGDRDVRDGFNVVQTFMRDGLEWVKLAPKTRRGRFQLRDDRFRRHRAAAARARRRI